MHKILILAKVLLKGGGSSDKKGKRRWWLGLVLGFAFLSFAFSVGLMTFGMYDALSTVGAQDAIVPLAFGATSVVIFIFGIFYVVSVMYHADDVSTLLALPFRPYQILGAKFLTLVVYEYIFESFILVPMLVAYAVKSGADVLFVIYALLIFAMLPVIALVISSLIIMLVMRFTRFGKNKQVFNFVGGIIGIGVAIGFNVLMQTSVTNINAEQLINATTGPNSIVDTLGNLFPGIRFASDAMINSGSVSGLLSLLLFVACVVAAIAIFLGLGQLLYFKGLAGVTEAAAKRKKLSSEEMEKVTVSTPVSRAYVVKELRLLVRSPIAFLNCVLLNFMWPVIIAIMLFAGNQQSMDQIKVMLQTADSATIVAIMAGVGAFIACANGITSTAISREGQSLYFTKYIPVSMKKQLGAKALSGILLSGVGIVLMSVVALVLGVGILETVIGLLLGMGITVASSFIGLVIDVSKPKLSWMNEQQAIKQNVNVMLHMLIGAILGALIIVPPLAAGFSLIVTVLYVAVLAVVLSVLFWQSISKGSTRKLESMDV